MYRIRTHRTRSRITPVALMACLSLLVGFSVISAQANMIPLDFTRITSNNVENVASQLKLEIWDSGQANANGPFNTDLAPAWVNLNSDQVLFAIKNNVGISSNITEIYIDDGILTFARVINSLGPNPSFTDFAVGSPNPANLPAGATVIPPFVADVTLSADVASGPPSNGVNIAEDILGIVYNLPLGVTWTSVSNALDDGSLRVGLHVRSIGARGGSDSFVNNTPGGGPPAFTPVPEPGAILLLGSGLLGLGALARRKK